MTRTDETLWVVRRMVSVKGTGGVSATVVVLVQQAQVWVSVEPPFTWEAIMEPEKVDELIRTLAQARDDARRLGSARAVSRGGRQPVGNGDNGTRNHNERKPIGE